MTKSENGMKAWSYQVGYQSSPRETIEAATEQEAKNKIFALHGPKRIYPVSGQWGFTQND